MSPDKRSKTALTTTDHNNATNIVILLPVLTVIAPAALEPRLGDIAKGGLAIVQQTNSSRSRTVELLLSPLLLCPLISAPKQELFRLIHL